MNRFVTLRLGLRDTPSIPVDATECPNLLSMPQARPDDGPFDAVMRPICRRALVRLCL